MKKLISLLYLVIVTSYTYTGVPPSSKLLYDEGFIGMPDMILITGMVIVTTIYFLMWRQKIRIGKKIRMN